MGHGSAGSVSKATATVDPACSVEAAPYSAGGESWPPMTEEFYVLYYEDNIRYEQFLPIFFGGLRTFSIDFVKKLGRSTLESSQLFLAFEKQVGQLGDAIGPLPHHQRVLDYQPSEATHSLPMPEQEFKLKYNMVTLEEIQLVKDKVVDCVISFCLLTEYFP